MASKDLNTVARNAAQLVVDLLDIVGQRPSALDGDLVLVRLDPDAFKVLRPILERFDARVVSEAEAVAALGLAPGTPLVTLA